MANIHNIIKCKKQFYIISRKCVYLRQVYTSNYLSKWDGLIRSSTAELIYLWEIGQSYPDFQWQRKAVAHTSIISTFRFQCDVIVTKNKTVFCSWIKTKAKNSLYKIILICYLQLYNLLHFQPTWLMDYQIYGLSRFFFIISVVLSTRTWQLYQIKVMSSHCSYFSNDLHNFYRARALFIRIIY